MFKSLFCIFFSLFLMSCAHVEEEQNTIFFEAPREKIWEVLVFVLKPYPLKTINEQKGYIETEVLKAGRFWKAPYERTKDLSGYTSSLMVKMDYKNSRARVSVYKKIYKQRGFISNKEEVFSDMIEEGILLYRIARELKIRSYLERI